MKLIMEGASLLTGTFEDEMNEASGQTERNYYISGTFSTPEAKNRNGRVYSRAIWEREVEKYQKEINEKTVNTLGEWQHPPRSTVDPIKAVLRIVELKIDETGNVVGKAKILNNNTEATNSIKGLIKEGIKIGVSSRGVGKVSATGIVEDFKLITYDAVDMPSDYNAMLNGMVEGYTFENGVMLDKNYEVQENGCIGEICNMATNEKKEETTKDITEEKCPIQEKIDAAIKEAKEEIYENINDFLAEALAKKETDVVVEELSETNTEVSEEDKKEAMWKKIATSLAGAVSEEEKEEKEEKMCSKCGEKEAMEDGNFCTECSSKKEEDSKKED